MVCHGPPDDPIRTDTLAANAYLLAMPGTPCIFYPHWRDHQYVLQQMILARRLADIANTILFQPFLWRAFLLARLLKGWLRIAFCFFQRE